MYNVADAKETRFKVRKMQLIKKVRKDPDFELGTMQIATTQKKPAITQQILSTDPLREQLGPNL